MNNAYQGYRPGGDGAPAAPFSPCKENRRGRLVTGIALASVLAGGAAFTAVTLAGGAPPGAAPAVAPAAGPTGQAALLNSALSSATATSGGTTPGGSTSGAATPGPGHRARGALARLRLLGGIDGQFTFETKAGPRTIAFERGTIQSAASGDVVVRATDGTTWTWEIVSDSVIRDRGRKTAVSALSAGQLVFVGGPVVNGARDARLIVIRTSTKVAAAQ